MSVIIAGIKLWIIKEQASARISHQEVTVSEKAFPKDLRNGNSCRNKPTAGTVPEGAPRDDTINPLRCVKKASRRTSTQTSHGRSRTPAHPLGHTQKGLSGWAFPTVGWSRARVFFSHMLQSHQPPGLRLRCPRLDASYLMPSRSEFPGGL